MLVVSNGMKFFIQRKEVKEGKGIKRPKWCYVTEIGKLNVYDGFS